MRIKFVLAAWLFASAVQASTLSEQLDAAWRMSPEARALEARAHELKARGVAVDGLLAAPPTVAVSYRGDNFTGNAGQRDYEAELGFPLWLPGQRAANRGALDAEGLALTTQRAALRLKLAGALREKNASVRRASAELALTEARLTEARALEADVERRTRAGDLARTDFLAARMETLAMQREIAVRQTARDAARAALKLFSGTDQAALAEPLADSLAAASANHPELASRQAALAAAHEKYRATEQNRRDAPELALFGRREWRRLRQQPGRTPEISLRYRGTQRTVAGASPGRSGCRRGAMGTVTASACC